MHSNAEESDCASQNTDNLGFRDKDSRGRTRRKQTNTLRSKFLEVGEKLLKHGTYTGWMGVFQGFQKYFA